jgi:DNA-directed RNA polymerase specialized sigma24 family protein
VGNKRERNEPSPKFIEVWLSSLSSALSALRVPIAFPALQIHSLTAAKFGMPFALIHVVNEGRMSRAKLAIAQFAHRTTPKSPGGGTMKHQNGTVETNEYAVVEDFQRIFEENMASLYLLALLLTGDHDKAEQCFIAGLEETVQANQVFKVWAHRWARRTIIQNAIRALKPHPNAENTSLPATDSVCTPARTLIDSDLFHVLALDDFERFVFVMSVLERMSDLECAVLLGYSVEKVREARVQALLHTAAAWGQHRGTQMPACQVNP